MYPLIIRAGAAPANLYGRFPHAQFLLRSISLTTVCIFANPEPSRPVRHRDPLRRPPSAPRGAAVPPLAFPPARPWGLVESGEATRTAAQPPRRRIFHPPTHVLKDDVPVERALVPLRERCSIFGSPIRKRGHMLGLDVATSISMPVRQLRNAGDDTRKR